MVKVIVDGWDMGLIPESGTVRLRKNIWGNWVISIGGKRCFDFGSEYDARIRLQELLGNGKYKISTKGD